MTESPMTQIQTQTQTQSLFKYDTSNWHAIHSMGDHFTINNCSNDNFT